ncbi:RNA-directed DNA polymerase from mobile element jockey [Mycena venus]|uniref:RNA-directed DNA polymerase from mobile element jockey n=1 Tax=Mycena venus TaxID=2733690 RepID=A0A8H6XR81_9AGAR|nr:RNA-directed DNA polymerase from mobile element jockey [Mycena venus]
MGFIEIPSQDQMLASLLFLPHVESISQFNTDIAPGFQLEYAQIFSLAGKYKQAEKLQLEALKKREEALGDNDLSTLVAMGNLAVTYSRLREFKKAQELEIVVLEKRKQSLGDNHSDTLRAMGNLAYTYRNLGEFKKAKELEIVVLEKRKQFLGDNHPETLTTMGHLARTYSNLGEFKKAQELEIVVLEKRKQFLGDNHPDTLAAIGNLACIYGDLGEFKKAQELEIVVVEKLKQFLGDNHPHTLHTMANLARTYWDLREFAKAEELQLLLSAAGIMGTSSFRRSTWFKSVIIGLLKKGKLSTNPDSYRIIALESCILKLLTLLIHKHITDWASARSIIPDYQNGFREGYRTNNNLFILRCVKEWARTRGLTIYMAAVDATNAFPSTDHPTLWLKLIHMGMGGAIFNWLCMLYERMEYYVGHGDQNSAEFKAFIGLLTGDPASPVLWNLFMADLVMLDDPDNPILSNIRIAILAQADDILLISLSAAGLQRRLNALGTWCSKNFIVVNKIKTIIMIFGPAPTSGLQFHLGANTLAIKVEEKYVGMNFNTSTRNMFADHYKAKASTARYCAHRIMGIEDSAGRLTPKQFKDLYMARVDCHLIHGCKVSPDCEDVHVKQLCAIQVDFLQQVLNVHSQSMLVCLFTETGIMPLQIHRFLLLLGYLQYLLLLKLSHLARACLNNLIELAAAGKKSWVGDILIATKKMPFSIHRLILPMQRRKLLKAIENWWKEMPRNGYSRKWISQTSSTCCTEDANPRRTNLPFKKPFI